MTSREPYLAKTKGARSFPWRVFVLGDSPSDLVTSDAVYALATPNSSADFSWVKPGQVAWDWWNGFKIDFVERDDQDVERFLEETAVDAAEHCIRRAFTIKAGEPLKVSLAPGGGFAAKFTAFK